MKNRKMAVLSLMMVLTMILSVSVSALVPGDELDDVKTTKPVAVDQSSPGKPVEVMDDISGVAVVLSANILPAGVTSVSLETATLKKEVAEVAMKEVTEKVVAALSDPSKIAENVSKESEQLVKNYDIKPVSAIALNLFDTSNAKDKQAITELAKPASFTVPVPKGVSAIAYTDPKTGKLVIIQGKVKNGFMTFDTKVVGVQFVLLELTKK